MSRQSKAGFQHPIYPLLLPPRTSGPVTQETSEKKRASSTTVLITTPKSTTPTMTSATAASTTIVNQLKPHRSEAAQRLRLNGVSLVALFVVSNLMPLPSLQTALRVFVAAKNSYRDEDEWNLEWWFKWSCLIGTCVLCLLKKG